MAFFQLFPNATSISVAGDNPSFTSHNGMLFGRDDAGDATSLLLVPEGLEGNAVLPDSLATVPAYVFSRCNKLTAISFTGSTNTAFAIRNAILYTNDLTTLLAAPAGLGSTASLAPECVRIAEGAFWGNAALETIVVSSSVDVIEADAFLDEVVPNATVALTGDFSRAAWEAVGFTRFTEPAQPGAEAVTESGLAYTLLDDYTLAVRWAGNEAASGYVEVPAQAAIDGVDYPVSVVADGAFEGAANLTQIGLPETLTTIGARAFAGTGLTYVYVPTNVTSLGEAAFQGCAQMRSVNLNGALAAIGAHAFDGCAQVQYFVLPATVQSIGAYAMAGIEGLKNIVALGSVASVDPAALVGVSGANIYVPYVESGEYAWSMGAPVANNHLMPYGVKAADAPLELAVDESANLFEGGWLEAPGDIQVNYSYKAKPMSIDADGTVTGKAEGASAIAVSLTLSLGEAEAISQVQPEGEGEGSMSVLRAVRSVGATGSMTYTLGVAAGAARVNAAASASQEDGIAPQADAGFTLTMTSYTPWSWYNYNGDRVWHAATNNQYQIQGVSYYFVEYDREGTSSNNSRLVIIFADGSTSARIHISAQNGSLFHRFKNATTGAVLEHNSNGTDTSKRYTNPTVRVAFGYTLTMTSYSDWQWYDFKDTSGGANSQGHFGAATNRTITFSNVEYINPQYGSGGTNARLVITEADKSCGTDGSKRIHVYCPGKAFSTFKDAGTNRVLAFSDQNSTGSNAYVTTANVRVSFAYTLTITSYSDWQWYDYQDTSGGDNSRGHWGAAANKTLTIPNVEYISPEYASGGSNTRLVIHEADKYSGTEGNKRIHVYSPGKKLGSYKNADTNRVLLCADLDSNGANAYTATVNVRLAYSYTLTLTSYSDWQWYDFKDTSGGTNSNGHFGPATDRTITIPNVEYISPEQGGGAGSNARLVIHEADKYSDSTGNKRIHISCPGKTFASFKNADTGAVLLFADKDSNGSKAYVTTANVRVAFGYTLTMTSLSDWEWYDHKDTSGATHSQGHFGTAENRTLTIPNVEYVSPEYGSGGSNARLVITEADKTCAADGSMRIHTRSTGKTFGSFKNADTGAVLLFADKDSNGSKAYVTTANVRVAFGYTLETAGERDWVSFEFNDPDRNQSDWAKNTGPSIENVEYFYAEYDSDNSRICIVYADANSASGSQYRLHTNSTRGKYGYYFARFTDGNGVKLNHNSGGTNSSDWYTAPSVWIFFGFDLTVTADRPWRYYDFNSAEYQADHSYYENIQAGQELEFENVEYYYAEYNGSNSRLCVNFADGTTKQVRIHTNHTGSLGYQFAQFVYADTGQKIEDSAGINWSDASVAAANKSFTPRVKIEFDLITYTVLLNKNVPLDGVTNEASFGSCTATVDDERINLPSYASNEASAEKVLYQGYHLPGSGEWASTDGNHSYNAADGVTISKLLADGNAVGSNNTITLNAQWIENSYTIVFASKGSHTIGLPSSIADVPYESTPISVTANDPIDLGYGFTGYTGPNDAAVVSGTTKIADVLDSTDFPADGSTITLTANWELLTYTINFANANDVDGDALLGTPNMTDVPAAGASTITTDIEKARSNDKTTIFSNEPTLTGYTFGGFAGGNTTATYAKGAAIDEEIFKALFGADGSVRAVTLNGVWTAKDYTIEYHSNYQDASQADATSTATVNYKDSFAAPDAATLGFTKLGYAYSGWLDAASGASIGTPATVQDLVAKMGDNSPIKLYVQWTAGENKFVVKYYWQDPATGDYVEGTSRTVTQVNGHNLLTGDVVNLKDGMLGSETASELQGYYLDRVTGRSDYSYDATTYADHSVDYLYDLNADKGSATTITLPEDGSGQFEVYYDVLGKVVFTGDGYTNDATPLDALTHVKYGQASQALGGLAFDKLNDNGKTWVSFKAWSDAGGNEYAAGATPTVTTNVVLHPVWNKNVYTVQYAEKAGQEGRVSTSLTAADPSFVTTFTEDDFGPSKDQAKSLNTATANTGYTWNGWDAADDSDVPNISLGDGGTFAKLFPHAVSGNEADRVATVYADVSANAYRINFAKYMGGSDGLGITPVSFTLDDASIVLPGNNAVADNQRMYGYSLCDWRIGGTVEAPAFISNAGTTLDTASLKKLIEAASASGGDIAPDSNGERTINVYAGWTAMYSVTVPDNSRVLFDIDVSNMPADKTYTAGDQPISVTSKTPMPIMIGAVSAKTNTASNVFGNAVDQVKLAYDGVEFDLDGGTPSFGTTVPASTSTNEQALTGPLSMTLNDAVVGEMLAKLEQNQSNQLAVTNVAKITWLVDMVDVNNGTGGVKPDDRTQVWVFSDANTKVLTTALNQTTQALNN